MEARKVKDPLEVDLKAADEDAGNRIQFSG